MLNRSMETQHKYNAWKAKSNGEPIEGTDRILTGVSKRDSNLEKN